MIAYLFPGPGIAEPGLGKDLYNKIPLVREAVDKADKILVEQGVKVTKACFVSPAEVMKRPSLAGPAVLAMTVGVMNALKARRVSGLLAGALGWGELNALVALGSLDYESGLKLLHQRGLWLEEAWAAAPFHVLGVQGLPTEQLQAKLAALPDPPRQVALFGADHVVLAGDEALLKKLAALLGPLGRHVKLSSVEPGYDWPHPIFAGVGQRVAEALSAHKLEHSNVAIQAAADEEPVRLMQDWPKRAAAQCTDALDWPAACKRLRALGMDTAVELTHGQALGVALHKFDAGVRVLAAEDAPSFALAAKLAV
jgi:[acyl-carrier-protein] S-malonyltransferase